MLAACWRFRPDKILIPYQFLVLPKATAGIDEVIHTAPCLLRIFTVNVPFNVTFELDVSPTVPVGR